MAETQVSINIRNTINLRSNGKIRVVILSSPAFDSPANVNPDSLTFGRTGAEPSLLGCDAASADVNGDGLPDVVCRFDAGTAGFISGDTVGVLRGRTFDDVPIRGVDSVRIIH